VHFVYLRAGCKGCFHCFIFSAVVEAEVQSWV